MLRMYFFSIIFVIALSQIALSETQSSDQWQGEWRTQINFDAGHSSGIMTLTQTGKNLKGSSTPLGENKFFPLPLKGTTKNDVAKIILTYKEDKAGTFIVTMGENSFTGTGKLFGVNVSVTATKLPLAANQPRNHTLNPDRFTTQYTTNVDPILTISDGDTVSTQTLDNEGKDRNLHWRGMPGNTLTGPFYVKNAAPGDTLVVHLEKISLNRDTAKMYSATLNQKAVQGGYSQSPKSDWNRIWIIDHDKQQAYLQKTSTKLKGLSLPVKPMIGSIGVAPPLNQSIYAGDLGFHGGNLDYNQIVEGAKVYIPVWRDGAYLFIGDGHALQGDGEISGQGLETSLDVTFKVELIKQKSLGQIWSENDAYVMISGIDNTLDSSLQMATTGMAQWLKDRYNLNDSEIATVMSAAIEYDIAEIVDPRPHVVAKIKKTTLAMINE